MRPNMEKMLAATFVLCTMMSGRAQSTPPRPAQGMQMPVAIMVLSAKAEGVQIYDCRQTNGAWHWNLKAPEAKLMDESGKVIGEHSAGPTWKLKDGSEVVGKLQSSMPHPGTIPWLLLTAASNNGKGALSNVVVIRRTDTTGGVAPETGCDAQHAGAEVRVPYTALYSFLAHN